VAETTIHGNMATTTYSGGTTTEFIKPGQDSLHPSVEGGPGQFTAAWRYLGGREV
jgi:hypothetical protein